MPVITRRATRLEARYTPEGGIERCGYCRHFVSQGSCNRIIGPVSPRGWCKFFSQQITHSVLDPGGQSFVSGLPPGITLDLSFMTPGTLPSGVTFTRGSTATYFDATGTMQTARTNLALWSGDLSNATWFKSSAGGPVAPVVTGNAAVAPDGTMTASQVVLPAVPAGRSIVQQNIVSTGVATGSFWLRGSVGGEQTYIGYEDGSGTTFVSAPVTLTTTWQRFSLNVNMTGAWFTLGTDRRDGTQNATLAQTIFAWGAQFEAGTPASAYIPTTSTTNGAPRWDYNPSTLQLNGLLIEEARTNQMLNSGRIDTWGTANTTLVAGVAGAPDGSNNGAKIIPTTASGQHAASQTTPITANQVQTFTIFLKPAGYPRATILVSNAAITNYAQSTFDITAGTMPGSIAVGGAATQTARSITYVGNGWYRCSITCLLDATSTNALTYVYPDNGVGNSFAGDGVSGTFAWGAQLEAGAFPTSYIPTTGATVTRSQEQCSIPSGNMGFYVSPGGSWAMEFIDLHVSTTSSTYVLGQHNGMNNAIPMYITTSTPTLAQWAGTTPSTTGNTVASGVVTKGATGYSTGTAQSQCLNAGTVTSGATSGTGYPLLATSGVDFLRTNEGGATQMQAGYIRRVRYWPRLLTNTELQQVTT